MEPCGCSCGALPEYLSVCVCVCVFARTCSDPAHPLPLLVDLSPLIVAFVLVCVFVLACVCLCECACVRRLTFRESSPAERAGAPKSIPN